MNITPTNLIIVEHNAFLQFELDYKFYLKLITPYSWDAK